MELKDLLGFEEKQVANAFIQAFESTYEKSFVDSYEAIKAEKGEELSSFVDRIAERIHAGIVIGLGIQYLKSKSSETNDASIFESFVSEDGVCPIYVDGVRSDEIPELVEALHVSYLNSHLAPSKKGVSRSRSKVNIIEKGAVYTLSQIVDDIVEGAFDNYSLSNVLTPDMQVLDFACGTGRFYISSVKRVAKELKSTEAEAVLNNINAIDLDPNAVNITRIKAYSFLPSVAKDDIQNISTRILWRNGLMKAGLLDDGQHSLLRSDFDGKIDSGFDIIVSNPPYLVLKNSKKGGTEESARKFKNQVDYFKKSGEYVYSIEGMLNLYQLSIERMLSMLKENGELGVICPSSLFADISATKLRKHMLTSHNVRSIRYYAEDDLIFENVLQATVIFQLQKNGVTNLITVNDGKSTFEVDVNLVKQLFPDKMEIPFITEPEWDILKHISTFKKMKDIPEIRNKRGELDVSLGRPYITTKKTKYRLVRGNMISADGIRDINGEYVIEDFIGQKSEDFRTKDFGKKRLVCQQISNAGQVRRLKFVFCEEFDILGNSCNYLSADPDMLKKLYIVMNSSLMNWRFKITSSNNHINNYELAELPMPNFADIDSSLTFATQKELDEYVNGLYGVRFSNIYE